MEKVIEKDNTGALFKNDKKKTEKHPDFTGDITIGGKKYRLAGWKRTSSKGTAFISIQATIPETKSEPKNDFLDDDIGF